MPWSTSLELTQLIRSHFVVPGSTIFCIERNLIFSFLHGVFPFSLLLCYRRQVGVLGCDNSVLPFDRHRFALFRFRPIVFWCRLCLRLRSFCTGGRCYKSRLPNLKEVRFLGNFFFLSSRPQVNFVLPHVLCLCLSTMRHSGRRLHAFNRVIFSRYVSK